MDNLIKSARTKPCFAFSLVELSIVLVILGLLVGGILAGKSLIRASELRTITTQYSNYSSAIKAFKDKYFYLPGDIPNATSFWGARDGGDGRNDDCSQAAASGTTTCNGDGDGYVHYWMPFYTAENFLFWQHLANAGLIEGNYNGGAGIVTYYIVYIGTNIPAARFGSAGWSLFPEAITNDPNYSETRATNKLMVGAKDTAPADINRKGFITPEEMWNIDTKMDDGKPMTGFVRPVLYHQNGNTCTNAANSTDSTATYDFTNTQNGCAILFEKLGENLF